MIGDDFVVKSKVKIHLVEKEGSYLFSSDGFLDGAKNHPLHKAMVNHDQQGVETGGDGEVDDKVTGDLLEWA